MVSRPLAAIYSLSFWFSLNLDLNLDFPREVSFCDIVESGNVILKLHKESFQNPICSVTYASGNRQHDSRSTQLGFFKFPDENADRDESDYGADNF